MTTESKENLNLKEAHSSTQKSTQKTERAENWANPKTPLPLQEPVPSQKKKKKKKKKTDQQEKSSHEVEVSETSVDERLSTHFQTASIKKQLSRHSNPPTCRMNEEVPEPTGDSETAIAKKSKKKKKKKKNSIWEQKDEEERQKIKEFWLSLGDGERRALVRLEKETVLKKMREQQRHICSCSVCGKRRTVIEEELEMLYDAYYEELQHYEDSKSEVIDGASKGSVPFDFARSLTAKGGILTVADDLLKNEGKKFLELMEKLAERRIRGEDEADEDGYEYEEYEEEEEMSEEQRLEQGRRMFQMFAAKMFEQRVLAAYREKVALEKQERLIKEEEEEERILTERRENKLRRKREAQEKKRILVLQQQEQERKRKEKEEQEKKQRPPVHFEEQSKEPEDEDEREEPFDEDEQEINEDAVDWEQYFIEDTEIETSDATVIANGSSNQNKKKKKKKKRKPKNKAKTSKIPFDTPYTEPDLQIQSTQKSKVRNSGSDSNQKSNNPALITQSAVPVQNTNIPSTFPPSSSGASSPSTTAQPFGLGSTSNLSPSRMPNSVSNQLRDKTLKDQIKGAKTSEVGFDGFQESQETRDDRDEEKGDETESLPDTEGSNVSEAFGSRKVVNPTPTYSASAPLYVPSPPTPQPFTYKDTHVDHPRPTTSPPPSVSPSSNPAISSHTFYSQRYPANPSLYSDQHHFQMSYLKPTTPPPSSSSTNSNSVSPTSPTSFHPQSHFPQTVTNQNPYAPVSHSHSGHPIPQPLAPLPHHHASPNSSHLPSALYPASKHKAMTEGLNQTQAPYKLPNSYLRTAEDSFFKFPLPSGHYPPHANKAVPSHLGSSPHMIQSYNQATISYPTLWDSPKVHAPDRHHNSSHMMDPHSHPHPLHNYHPFNASYMGNTGNGNGNNNNVGPNASNTNNLFPHLGEDFTIHHPHSHTHAHQHYHPSQIHDGTFSGSSVQEGHAGGSIFNEADWPALKPKTDDRQAPPSSSSSSTSNPPTSPPNPNPIPPNMQHPHRSHHMFSPKPPSPTSPPHPQSSPPATPSPSPSPSNQYYWNIFPPFDPIHHNLNISGFPKSSPDHVYGTRSRPPSAGPTTTTTTTTAPNNTNINITNNININNTNPLWNISQPYVGGSSSLFSSMMHPAFIGNNEQ